MSHQPPSLVTAVSAPFESYIKTKVSRPVYFRIKHPFGAYDQIFITVRLLQICWCGAISLTRAEVCYLQLLLVLASAVSLGSESRGTRDHILLSPIRNFPFRRLLRTRRATVEVFDPASTRRFSSQNPRNPLVMAVSYIASSRTAQRTPLPTVLLVLHLCLLRPLPSNSLCILSHYLVTDIV
jgi:hypothetical protein